MYPAWPMLPPPCNGSSALTSSRCVSIQQTQHATKTKHLHVVCFYVLMDDNGNISSIICNQDGSH